MSFPRISLITPSFNQGNFIEQTIRSVIDQQYPNLQYMIFDGGSNDQTVDIIRKYANSISYWISEKDSGQSHAINKGLKMADGDIVGWLNSDDYLEKNALFTLAKNFSDKNTNCVIGKISYFNEKGPLWKSKNVVKNPAENTIGAGIVPQPAMYFRKACYDKIGLLSEQLNYSFDSEWYIRYLLYYGIEGILEIPDVVVNFRFHKDSKTMNNRFAEERNSIFRAIADHYDLKEIRALLEQLYPFDPNYQFIFPEKNVNISIEKAMNYHLFLLVNEYYAKNDRKSINLCLNLLDENQLGKEDLIFLKKLKFKNSYLPLPLIKFLRKRKNK